jgi:hypothetical protein
MLYDLDCRYDTRASFYGKARVEEYEDENARTLHLLSYGTFVANIVYYKNKNKKVYEYFGRYSQTTTRHQKEFFRQNGLSDKEIKELFKNDRLEKEF